MNRLSLGKGWSQNKEDGAEMVSSFKNNGDVMDSDTKDLELIAEDYRKHGHEITLEQAGDIWSEFSDSLCASWIIVGDDSKGIYNMTSVFAKTLNII